MSLSTTLVYSVSAGTVLGFGKSYLQNSSLNGIHEDTVEWLLLSLVHVTLVGAVAFFLESYNVLRLSSGPIEPLPQFIGGFVLYCMFFEAWYYLTHLAQHKIRIFGQWTKHALHHQMKDPDYLNAFMAHPIDAIMVQIAAQSPWIACYCCNIQMTMSSTLYGSIIAFLVFLGIRAHCKESLGGQFHSTHHKNPAKGYYSFSGIPDAILAKKSTPNTIQSIFHDFIIKI